MQNIWDMQIAQRWEQIRANARLQGWDGNKKLTIREIARKNGFKWYHKNKDDLVCDFISPDLKFFFTRLKSLGPKKCHHLMDVLELALHNINSNQSFSSDSNKLHEIQTESLKRWNIPDDYPVNLIFNTSRIIDLFERKSINSIQGIIQLWSILGPEKILEQTNIGINTLNELQNFIKSVNNSDAKAARHWLPLNETETGLCLRNALLLAHTRYPVKHLKTIYLRIVEGYSLEAAGKESFLTRERVRQLELTYLRAVEQRLKFFHHEWHKMLDAWANETDWDDIVRTFQFREYEVTIISAIEKILSKTPQGMARRLSEEQRIKSWLETAMSHPELSASGFDLQAFLDAYIPNKWQHTFIRELSSKSNVVIDYAAGIVKAA
jgi:hypothetical protein